MQRLKKQNRKKQKQINKINKRSRKSIKGRRNNRFCQKWNSTSKSQKINLSYCLCKQYTFLDHLEKDGDRKSKRQQRKIIKYFGSALRKRSNPNPGVRPEDGSPHDQCSIVDQTLIPQCFRHASARRAPAGLRLTQYE